MLNALKIQTEKKEWRNFSKEEKTDKKNININKEKEEKEELPMPKGELVPTDKFKNMTYLKEITKSL